MSSGVMITLIICVTLIILFGIAFVGGSRSKKEKEILDYLNNSVSQPTWTHETKYPTKPKDNK